VKKIVVSDKLRRYAADLELEPANGAHRRAFHSVVIPNACNQNDRVTARNVSRDVSKKGMGVRAGCAVARRIIPSGRTNPIVSSGRVAGKTRSLMRQGVPCEHYYRQDQAA